MTEMLPLFAIVAVVVALAAVRGACRRALAQPPAGGAAGRRHGRAGAGAERYRAAARSHDPDARRPAIAAADAVNERLESVSHRLGNSLQKTTAHTTENLQKLHERLAVIDSAQKNITALATQVTSLQSVLANKQERGAFGQGRMEAIVQDGLPKGCYEFQYTLSNKMRPDCACSCPSSGRWSSTPNSRSKPSPPTGKRRPTMSVSRRPRACAPTWPSTSATSRGKYLIPGETQDIALMFVPSESLYADLQETFDDVVQKAFRAKVVIVSPSLLMVCIQLVQQMQKEERMREAAGQIQAEVGRLIDDVSRMRDRVLKLQGHFNQTNEDVRQIVISSEKVQKRGARIAEVEFDEDGAEIIPAPMTRKLEAGE